ncbi:hypothetical protein JTE90_017514 [Oedothorax gibbosus]|uniref:Uncharacterized protein n=1 Tax=Oedothorax gibbosus TaxID=931172 RepID=A0AAV6TL86_9ARAC|nr:hypothetical protein JTE90_017514 [Oedothorax gibbosus]
MWRFRSERAGDGPLQQVPLTGAVAQSGCEALAARFYPVCDLLGVGLLGSATLIGCPARNEKYRPRGRSAAFGIPVPSRAGRTGDPRVPLVEWRSLSAHVGTRKMVKLCPDRTRPEETLVEVRRF